MKTNENAFRNGGGLTYFAIGVILVHLAISIVHGVAHSRLDIGLSVWQQVFVATVITIAPLVAGFLLWRNKVRAGGSLLLVSMAGAFIFGVIYHFLAPGADNVNHEFLHAPATWMVLFDRTAWGIAALELVGAVLGLVIVLKHRKTS